MYEDGLLVKDIAKRFGFSQTTILKAFDSAPGDLGVRYRAAKDKGYARIAPYQSSDNQRGVQLKAVKGKIGRFPVVVRSSDPARAADLLEKLQATVGARLRQAEAS